MRKAKACVCLLLQDQLFALVQSCLRWGGGGYGRTCATKGGAACAKQRMLRLGDSMSLNFRVFIISYQKQEKICLSPGPLSLFPPWTRPRR